MLAAGEITSQCGNAVHIHLLEVAGAQVDNVRTASIGASVVTSIGTPFGSVDPMQDLPDGNLLFTARGIAGCSNASIGHLDVSTLQVTRLATTITPGGELNAPCLSPDGRTAYIGVFTGSPRSTTMPRRAWSCST